MLSVKPTQASRAGFTLVELVITLVLVSFVAGAIVKLLLRQHGFDSSTAELIQTRQQIRQAAAMLHSDLRGISSIGGDIYVMTDSSLEFRSVFGSSIVCVNSLGKLSTVPRTLARGSAMTNWSALPSVGDSLAVYNDSTSFASTDDAWVRHQITLVTTITSATSTSGCPTSTLLTQAGELTTPEPRYQLTLSPAASSQIRPGPGIRLLRRCHHYVFPASDTYLYLCYIDCNTGR